MSVNAIVKTDDLPIKHTGNVHSGKVRSVYWLTEEDSEKLAGMGIGRSSTSKAVMVISDRISAFECKWKTAGGLRGVPGKGAALNAIAKYWFDRFDENGLAGNHILTVPHPLVWIVEKAEPVMIEAIARQYITGSMWRDYAKGKREFGGVTLSEGLEKDQKLPELLVTPSTKGILTGIPGVPEQDDVNITREQIVDNHNKFGFLSLEDVGVYEKLLREGFEVISKRLEDIGKIFVDTKFEFGYVPDENGGFRMIYMDEIGTPDSSRYWDAGMYSEGKTVEESKEVFRQELLNSVPDRDVLLDKNRMDERVKLSEAFEVPDEVFIKTSNLYREMAERITGEPMPVINDARQEIIEALKPFELIE